MHVLDRRCGLLLGDWRNRLRITNSIIKLFRRDIDLALSPKQDNGIRYQIALTNVLRGRIYCLVLVVMEILLVIFADIPGLQRAAQSDMWIYRTYFILHIAAAAVSLAGFIVALLIHKQNETQQLIVYEVMPAVFALLILVLVSIITGLDQISTGQINAYIPAILIVSVLVLIKYPLNVAVFTVSHVVFIVSVVAFQKDAALLSSNIINGSILFVAVVIVSMFMYENQYSHLAKNMYLDQANQKLQHLATHDQLTGLPNRRYFEDYFAREIAFIKRFKQEAALIFLDVDYFKNINDEFGHFVGDYVLEEMAKVLTENMRDVDFVARWGGEEFILFLPQISSYDALFAANRVREIVAEHVFLIQNRKLHITVSLGMKLLDWQSEIVMDDVCVLADQALYRAKSNGRNRVEIAS